MRTRRLGGGRRNARLRVQTAPGERQRRVGAAARRQDLIHPRGAGLEFERARSHVQAPDPIGRLVHLAQGRLALRFETPHPMPEGQRIVAAQGLDIFDLEPRALHAERDIADAIEFAIGKHITIDERCLDRPIPAFFVVGDAVIEEQAARAQHPLHAREVGRQIGQAHMLDHADACHLVVDDIAEIAVVAQLDTHQIFEPFGSDARTHIVQLRLAERDAVRPHAVMARRPADQGAPAAANVEQALAGTQLQLAANVFELVDLRLIERVRFGLEIGA